MEFEVDVSGNDLLSKNYSICIANKDSIIKGYKFNKETVKILSSRYGQGLYRYSKSRKRKANFKIRLYRIIIYHLFKSIKISEDLSLTLCKDFDGRENDIRENLRYFLMNNLNLDLRDRIYFSKLGKKSNAHKYAFLMRKDKKNKMQTYVKIDIKNMEKWLKK